MENRRYVHQRLASLRYNYDSLGFTLGTIFIIRKDIGVGGWSKRLMHIIICTFTYTKIQRVMSIIGMNAYRLIRQILWSRIMYIF